MCWRPTPRGKTTFVNDEACRLLEIEQRARPPGRRDRFDAAGARRVQSSADPTPTIATVGDRIVVVSARKVARDGNDLGTVLVVRDRTDVESLTRQLDAVQLMSTALRAQRHEFANRLHLLNGLLHSGHVDEAEQYLEELLGSGPLGSALPGIDAVRDAYPAGVPGGEGGDRARGGGDAADRRDHLGLGSARTARRRHHRARQSDRQRDRCGADRRR